MAKIVPSELAPSEAVHYSLGNVEFDLGGKSEAKSFETDDRVVIDNAVSHPWLNVEFDAAPELSVEAVDTRVRPEDDVLGAFGPRANDAFDPEKIKAAEAAKVEDAPQPLAIDAGLNQDEDIKTDTGAAETLAADETHRPAKSSRNFTTTEDSE